MVYKILLNGVELRHLPDICTFAHDDVSIFTSRLLSPGISVVTIHSKPIKRLDVGLD
jgi:hypothetical protein